MCYSFLAVFKLIPRAMNFVFNKSHMLVSLNLVAKLMYLIYVNNTLPLALVARALGPIRFVYCGV